MPFWIALKKLLEEILFRYNRAAIKISMEGHNIPRSQLGLIIAIVFAAITISGSLIFFVLKSGNSDMAQVLKDNPQLAALLDELKKEEQKSNITASYEQIVDDDAVLGNANAPVTLVEFSDYQCPFCRRHFTQTHSLLVKNYVETGKLKIVFRDFPLSFHSDAISAAMAAQCTRDQKGDSGYYQMHDKIFEGQQKLGSGTVEIPTESLKEYARDLSLTMNDFLSCLESGKYKSEIDADVQSGSEFGVGGTPGFILTNGKQSKRIDGAQPYSLFESEINAFL